MLRIILGIVRFAKELRWKLLNLVAYYKLFLFLIDLGLTSAWILWIAFLSLMGMKSYWWWWIDLPSMFILLPFLILILLLELLLCSWGIFSSFMVCLNPLYVIGMLCSLLDFGLSCSSYKEQTWPCLQLITPKLLAKVRWLIGVWSSTLEPLLMINPRLGLIGYIWQNFGLIPIIILQLNWLLMRLYMVSLHLRSLITSLALLRWMPWISFFIPGVICWLCSNRTCVQPNLGWSCKLISINLIGIFLLEIGCI